MGTEKKKKGPVKDDLVKDGIARLYYADGKLRAEIPMKGGKRNGIATEYYANGKKHLVINYVDGLNHGLTTRYYDNGTLYEETLYDKGEMHGLRKRYRKNGSLESEANYYKGQACGGIKEYLLDGKTKKNYPKIVVEEVDRLLKDNKYILRLRMSDNNKNVSFYQGKLEGNCMTESLRPIPASSVRGVSELSFYLPPGMFVMEEISIVAKVKTPQGNFFVTQKSHNLAIEHR